MSEVERALYFLAALVAAFVVAFLVGKAVAPAWEQSPAPEHPHDASLPVDHR
ncbi:hypothetical protein [Nocardioides sp.]|uniref:hypothetical protein n=1 Tax=Nocardioides sp. TaxID=35761 RepID=UPI003528796D